MLWIKNGRLIDPKSQTDQICDICIERERIAGITPAGTADLKRHEGDEVIDASGLIVAPGLVDVHVHFRDPGFTYKEDMETGAAAAAAGGYTTVICMANTKPVVDNEETLKYLRDKAANLPVHVLNTAAITKGFGGKELTDMEKLKKLGAVGFTDDGVPIADTAVVLEAMKLAKALDVPLSFHEEDPALIGSFGINQGEVSKAVGVEGAPAVAEDVLVARDCALALTSGAIVNIQHISSKTSVEIVRLMKTLGGHIYAEATPQHFSLTEKAVLDKGTLAKVNPPIRGEADRMAIIQGLKDGTIDCIATDHAPHSSEEKAKDIKSAPSGMIGLETALALGITNLVVPEHLSLSRFLEKLTVNPAGLYHLDAGYIAVGGKADILIFDKDECWTVETFKSKSSNSPFIGEKLQGKVKYTICDGKVVYRD
ncbi:MAG: dihydroorotase [Clostridia bacterium]|nr:dihydroorotase [Lachnospiraceae bacterium]NCC00089.1 dihydroorotase [Clostridia bacterium]NCD01648.1 dihydroorotase [Clostridia bacterium]